LTRLVQGGGQGRPQPRSAPPVGVAGLPGQPAQARALRRREPAARTAAWPFAGACARAGGSGAQEARAGGWRRFRPDLAAGDRAAPRGQVHGAGRPRWQPQPGLRQWPQHRRRGARTAPLRSCARGSSRRPRWQEAGRADRHRRGRGPADAEAVQAAQAEGSQAAAGWQPGRIPILVRARRGKHRPQRPSQRRTGRQAARRQAWRWPARRRQARRQWQVRRPGRGCTQERAAVRASRQRPALPVRPCHSGWTGCAGPRPWPGPGSTAEPGPGPARQRAPGRASWRGCATRRQSRPARPGLSPRRAASMAAHDFDLLVVGASFGGAACAIAAADAGLRVCVLERKHDPGERLHTTGIVVREAAEETLLGQAPPECLRRVERVRLYSPALRDIALAAPGYYFLTTDTPALMRWLAAQIPRHGAQLRLGTSFTSAQRVSDGWEVPGVGRVRWLVGADGARSRVAERTGLGRVGDFLYGIEHEYAGLTLPEPDALHCFVSRRFAPGYIGWVAQNPTGVQAGLALRHDPANARVPDIDGFLAHVGARVGMPP